MKRLAALLAGGVVLGGIFSQPMAVNNLGQVVGSSLTTSSAVYHAFLAEAPGLPFAVNNEGQIAGASHVRGDSAVHAVLWSTQARPATSAP